ncbi:b(o/a)3-type cytochrome-c oxidase subunit 1 [Deinococcus multiflagellatus]|uniref:b(o/a)3-type cytochrome-c oxidase subunit 1 n=1 Tax=Deinococcus multiflagellatus TaxID=1656887 RepID=UPI001CCAAFFA|nr:b(o/a)3-type cytochrome-c oxidase subunit 1 [Deinococcus multiflagellatus]MBZ9713586.1 b(o/a)3-type cytochrome-c oxidase subunit 1 [Deinococcus multiflagellatus]
MTTHPTPAPPMIPAPEHPAAVRTLPAIDAASLTGLKKVTQYYVVTAFLALLIGVLIGPLQALNYAGIDVYSFPLIKALLKSYYQGLSLHGVLNALVFTQFFISGWMLYLPARDLGARINLKFAWFTYLLMTAGLLMAAVPLLTNHATLLYTFYPPMQGDALFYIGAAIMVGSSLLVVGQVVAMWWAWKRANPGRVTPLVTFMSVATWMMWFVASLGIVIEVLGLLIPWSLGLTPGVDPLLSKTLFWWTGHAIVYFWVLPAYISWYAFLPRHAGGRIVSEPLTRLVFVIFLLNSVPVGLHHQFSDPNISNLWKTIHMFLTFLIAVPSLLTAFSVAAALEDGARARGGQGLLGWITKLPWGNAIFSAQVLAMISFILGGAGGIVNASASFAPVVHNTAWIPGHFHITVGTATTLSFMGIALWLIPHLTGKRMPSMRLASAAVWTWFVGMMVFALGMHWQGLLGVTRRAQVSATAQDIYQTAELALPKALTGLSGVILLVSALLFFYVLFRMLLSPRVQDPESTPIPYSEAISPAGEQLATATPLVRLTEPLMVLWIISLLLVLMMYGPVIGKLLGNLQLVPGWRLY